MFWIAFMVIAIVAITFSFITQIVKMSQRHFENMARIKHGYPTIEQEKSTRGKRHDFVDMTVDITPNKN